MNKLAIVVLLVLAACHRQPAGRPASATSGAASAREAVERFLGTAKAMDYDGLGDVWGTAQGPARSTMDRARLERSAFVMMKCLRHDRYQILSETPTAAGERIFSVQLALRETTASTDFIAVPGPRARWYLREFRMEDLRMICVSI